MTLRARAFVIAGALVFAAAGLSAQRGPRGQGPGPLIDPAQMPPGGGGRGRLGAPPRDDQQAAPKGTGKISGRVISADTGNPIRRAQVRLTSPEIRVNRTGATDNDGRYEFSDLVAGHYRLQISKAGYVTLEYGQVRPFEAGKPLDLVESQPLANIDFSLPRGSVIAGRLTDEFGEPIADATVQAMRYQFSNGQRQLVTAGRQATSDDIGQYRIFGLMPGDYVVRATVRSNNAMLGAALGGPQAAEDPSGYPPTYYPGTTDVGQAQTITVAIGQELSSVFFSLSPARLAHVSGNVLDSQGKALTGGVVLLRPANGSGVGGAFNVGGANQVRADGTFALTSVPPGEYTLDVQQRPRDMQSLGTGALEFASVPLSVSGSDISGLTIITTPGVAVSGRVVLQGRTSQSTPSNSPQTQVPLRGIQIAAASPTGAQSILGIAGRALGGGRVADDGTFRLTGLSGPQLIRLGNVPNGWAVKSITLDGQDITDAPFEFKAGQDLTGMTVTLTDRLTELSGTVRDGRGQPVKDYVLVVFPDDSTLWGGQSRFIRTARPNQDGMYNIKGLPPARYLAVVLESLESGAQNDPSVLEPLKARGKPFLLTDAQALTLDLSFQP